MMRAGCAVVADGALAAEQELYNLHMQRGARNEADTICRPGADSFLCSADLVLAL
jgi:hypothetical protein